MAETRALEDRLHDLQKSWNRIHKALIPRTLHQVMFLHHVDVITFVIDEFSHRIGIRTLDRRIIPTTTGGIPPEFYEQVARISDMKKDSAYPELLHHILNTTHPPRTAMLVGMRHKLTKDYYLDNMKSCDAYVREEIEREMREGDGSYHLHMPKIYAGQVARRITELSLLGKERLTELYTTHAARMEGELSPSSVLQGLRSSQRPNQDHQEPRRKIESSLISASLDDIKRYSK